MLALALIIALGAAPATDPLAPYRGQPVFSVDIEAPADEDIDFLRSLISIQPGFLLTTSDLQATIKRLYALGRFSNVEVSARRLSGVVLLRFRLKPVLRLETLDIEGLQLAEDGPLRAALKLGTGAEVDRRTSARLQQRSRVHLERVGFPNARVVVKQEEADPDDGPVRSFTIHVEEGSPRRVDAIHLTGRARVPAAVLHEIVRTKRGGILDRSALAQDRKRLERAYLERGFLRVRVASPSVEELDGRVVVKYYIEAGDRIALHFRGNELFTEATLRTLWPEDTPRIRNGTLIRFVDRIDEHYRRRGYANVRVTTRAYRDAQRGRIRYLFDINEGKPVRVTSLVFVGAEAIAPATLQEQVRAVLRDKLLLRDDFQQLSSSDLELANRAHPSWGTRHRSASYQSPVPPEERWVKELFDEALSGIEAAYRDRGYRLAALGEPELEHLGPQELRVRVSVEEGPQTLVRSIRFIDNQARSASAAFAIIEEKTADRSEIDTGRSGRSVLGQQPRRWAHCAAAPLPRHGLPLRAHISHSRFLGGWPRGRRGVSFRRRTPGPHPQRARAWTPPHAREHHPQPHLAGDRRHLQPRAGAARPTCDRRAGRLRPRTRQADR